LNSAPIAIAALATPAAAGMTVAAPCFSGLLALVLPVGVTAATFYAASCYAWQNRYFMMAAAATCGFAALCLPFLLKELSKLCWRRCLAWDRFSHPKKRKASKGAIRRFSIWQRSATQILRRRGRRRIYESHSAATLIESSDDASDDRVFSSRREADSTIDPAGKLFRRTYARDHASDGHVLSSPKESDSPTDPAGKLRRRSYTSDRTKDARVIFPPRPVQCENPWNPVFCASLESEENACGCDANGNTKKRKLNVHAERDASGSIVNPNPLVSIQAVECACQFVFKDDHKFCTNCGAQRPAPQAQLEDTSSRHPLVTGHVPKGCDWYSMSDEAELRLVMSNLEEKLTDAEVTSN